MSLSPSTKSGLGAEVDDVVKTTYLYVKFVPKDEDELSLLKVDSILVLYKYPLDYEIIRYGGYSNYTTPKRYVDNVTGYTMSQIEGSLKGARNATQWKNNLKNKYSNETETYLDAAFAFWSVK